MSSLSQVYHQLHQGRLETTGKLLRRRDLETVPSGAVHMLCYGGAPVASAAGYAKGCIWIDTTNGVCYRNSGTVASATWTNLSTSGATNAFSTIACPAGSNPVADAATDTLTFASSGGTVTITGTAGTDTVNFDLASNKIANSHILTTAAIAFTKLAALTKGSVLTGQGSNVVTALNAKTDKYILIGDGTDVNSVLWSGDVALTNAGVSTVTDLTITSEVRGDVLIRGASAWVRLAAGLAGQGLVTAGAGSDPYWGAPTTGSASNLVNNFTMEGGTYDLTVSITTQTTGTATLTIPNFANVADQFTFDTLATTLYNKELDDATCFWADTADATKKVVWEISGATGGKTLTLDTNHDDDRTILFPNATCTLVGKDTTDILTNKTLTAPVFASGGFIADANGNEILVFTATGSATTYVNITNAINAGGVTIASAGGAAAEDLLLVAKGAGVVKADGVEVVTLTGSQALTNKTYEGLTITTSASGVLTIAASKTFTVSNTLTLDGTDGQTFTFPASTDTVACLGTAQEFTANQTIQYGHLLLRDNNEGQTLQVLIAEDMTGDKTLTILPNDGDRSISLSGDLVFGGNFTTPAAAIIFAGAFAFTLTTQNTTTFAFADATAAALTFPTGTETLVGKATTDVFTNKSLDCNGTGNVLTNANAAEVETVADAAFGIPFVMRKTFTNIVAAGTNVITTHPKMRIIMVWAVDTSGAGGTWCLHSGQNGALGNAITDVITPAGDKDVDFAGEIDDGEWDLAEDAGLAIVGDAGGTLDGEIFVMAIKIP